jgi:hypothetical protein
MRNRTCLWLANALAMSTIGFVGQSAMAQYTGEFLICTDGRSADACRNTALPVEDDGSIIWFRDFGSTLCAAVGFEPQEQDCTFFGSSYNGFDCFRVQDLFASRVVPAGGDLAIACGDVSQLFDGQYSLGTTRNTCFEDTVFGNLCQNFVLTR